MVLLHGLTGSGACWSPLARSLEDTYDVVMPDARGHGKSSAPPTGYGYDDHAGDVVGLIRGLGLTAPALMGHSMGGMTAAVVASRFGGAVRGVVLVDPTFLSSERQREVFDSGVAEQHRRFLALTREELEADVRRRHPHRLPELLALLAEAKLQTRVSAFDVLKPPNPDYRELLAAIRVPVLLVTGGGAGAVVSSETARELQGINPRLEVYRIPEAGHGLPYDHPERLAQRVASFLGALGGPSALGAPSALRARPNPG